MARKANKYFREPKGRTCKFAVMRVIGIHKRTGLLGTVKKVMILITDELYHDTYCDIEWDKDGKTTRALAHHVRPHYSNQPSL